MSKSQMFTPHLYLKHPQTVTLSALWNTVWFKKTSMMGLSGCAKMTTINYY